MAVPMTLTEANQFVRSFHRHNKPTQGGLFAVGASDGNSLVGVGIVGRPIARKLQDGATCEVTRCCVHDAAPKGTCSFIYAALWRAARALGWRRLVTYTLASESGASLRGAGFKLLGQVDMVKNPWGSSSGREREWQPIYGQLKLRWELTA